MIFRAIWPITDDATPWVDLCRQAALEVPALAAQAHAHLVNAGRFSMALSSQVPGSGRVTEWCLLFEARALRKPAREYHREVAA